MYTPQYNAMVDTYDDGTVTGLMVLAGSDRLQPGGGKALQMVADLPYDPILEELRGMNTHDMEHLGQYVPRNERRI